MAWRGRSLDIEASASLLGRLPPRLFRCGESHPRSYRELWSMESKREGIYLRTAAVSDLCLWKAWTAEYGAIRGRVDSDFCWHCLWWVFVLIRLSIGLMASWCSACLVWQELNSYSVSLWKAVYQCMYFSWLMEGMQSVTSCFAIAWIDVRRKM